MNYRQEGVSIIVPVYNGAAYIEKCLENVCSVDLPLKEVIVVNDGSTDDSPLIVENFIATCPDCSIELINQQNSGVAEARNKGMDAAHYGWITFVDADDLLIEHLCVVLDQVANINADIIRFGFVKIKKRSLPGGTSMVKQVSGNVYHDMLLLMKNTIGFVKDEEKIDNPPICVWAGFYKTQFIRKHHIRFPLGVKNGEDRIFNLQCLEHTDTVYLSDYPIYAYYSNPLSLTRRFKPDIRAISIAFYSNLDAIVDRHPVLGSQRDAALVNNFFLEMGHFLFHPSNKMGLREQWDYFVCTYRHFYKDVFERADYLFNIPLIKRIQLWAMKKDLFALAFLSFYIKLLAKRLIQR